MIDANRDHKTICSLASAAGTAAIAVIRMSGPEAFKIIQLACKSLRTKKLESHKVYLARFYDSTGATVDQVLVTTFFKGKSFTGEETVEISCHGSPHVTQKILETLVRLGAVTAEKGEFTYRAFMNDKLDLVQAEAVLSVIESQSDCALKMSLRQLEGQVSQQFHQMVDQLIWCLAHIEASIDFSTEGLDVVDPQVLIQKLMLIQTELKKIISTYNQGRILKNGIKLVLAGRPNVGKSSLLNNLILDEKAIVTDIAGTTRDVVEGSTVFQGLKYNIYDTAGLRDTTDLVESLGIQKSLKEIQSADMTLFVFDAAMGLSASDLEKLSQVRGKVLVLANKSDKQHDVNMAEAQQKLQVLTPDQDFMGLLAVSALDVGARDKILSTISEAIGVGHLSDESVISSARQFELSHAALDLLSQALTELEQQMGSEFVAQTLKNALLSLQKILGQVFDDQIMDRVFKEFCLGK